MRMEYRDMINQDIDSFDVLKFQSEIVTELPPNAVPLCSSKHSSSEIYMIGSNVLVLENHPEFTEKYLQHHIVKRLHDTLGINEDYMNEIINRTMNEQKEGEAESKLIQRELLSMCKRFLKD